MYILFCGSSAAAELPGPSDLVLILRRSVIWIWMATLADHINVRWLYARACDTI